MIKPRIKEFTPIFVILKIIKSVVLNFKYRDFDYKVYFNLKVCHSERNEM